MGFFKKLFGGNKSSSVPADLNSPEEIKQKLDGLMSDHSAKESQPTESVPTQPPSQPMPSQPVQPPVEPAPPTPPVAPTPEPTSTEPTDPTQAPQV